MPIARTTIGGMYTADWVGRAIRKHVGGKDADAARMLALMFASPPGIEERIARALNEWVASNADPADPKYWWNFVVVSRGAIRSWQEGPPTGPSRYYALDPEVPGGLGEHTVLIQRPGSFPLVERLHFEFGTDRFDDDLFTSHPAFLVRRRLADSLRGSALSGFDLSRDVEVSGDENVRDLEPGWQMPDVEWLRVSGTPGTDDFGLTDNAELVVSDAALRLLRSHAIDHCDVRPFAAA